MKQQGVALEDVDTCGARQEGGDDDVPRRIDGHAQATDRQFACQGHALLQHGSQHRYEEERNFWVEERNGKTFGKALACGRCMLLKQHAFVHVPHLPAVPRQQTDTDELEGEEHLRGLLQQHDEPKDGGPGVDAEPQPVTKGAHHALLASTQQRVAQDDHQTGSGRYGTEQKNGPGCEDHVHGKVRHVRTRTASASRLTVHSR